MHYVTIHDESMAMVAVLENADAVGYELVHNDLWNGTFALPNDDPKRVYCQAGAYVKIPDGDRMTGLYRITGEPESTLTSLGEMTTYTVEHVLGTLLDDVCFGSLPMANTAPADAIRQLLALQTVQRWVLGVCEYTEPISVDIANETVLSGIQKVCGQLPGDYTWTFDTAALPWVLNIVHADMEDGCGIYYARNMVEIKRSWDASQIVTRLWLQGGADSKGDLVRVGRINDGLDYIEADTVSRWGVRWAIYGNSDITTPEALLQYGRRVLESYKNPYYTYQATALDLFRVTGQAWDNYMPGKLVRVMDDAHGVRLSARIVSIKKGDVFGDPGGITITIANAPRDQLNAVSALAVKVGSLDGSAGSAASGINKAEAQIDDLKVSTETSFTKTDQQLELKASKEEVSALSGRVTNAETSLTVQSEGMTALSTRITTLEGEQEETSAQLKVNNDSIGTLVTSTTALESRIAGTETAFSQYSDEMDLRVTNFEGRVTSAEASITLHANELQSRVTKDEYATFETQTNEAISLRALASDVETSLSVQNGLIAAKADRIELDGLAKASELEAEKARLDSLISGTLLATGIAANGGSFEQLTSSSYTSLHGVFVENVGCEPKTLTIGGKTCTFFAPSDATFDLSDLPGYDAALQAARNEGAAGVKIMADEITSEGDEAWYSSSKEIYVTVRAEATNGEHNTNRVSVDATAAYDAGAASVDTTEYWEAGYRAGYNACEAEGGGSVVSSDIQLDTFQWYDSSASQYVSSYTTLNTLAGVIRSHKNGQGYATFRATCKGASKYYKIAIG